MENDNKIPSDKIGETAKKEDVKGTRILCGGYGTPPLQKVIEIQKVLDPLKYRIKGFEDNRDLTLVLEHLG